MRFTSDGLLECAYERLDQALAILDSDPIMGAPLAAYVSGVAVECATRAKRMVVSHQVNSGHRLDDLATEADYASRLKGRTLEEYDASLNQMVKLWDNLLRYCSAEAYVEFLVRRGAEVPTPYGTVRVAAARRSLGDAETARRAAEATYDCARRIVDYGDPFWKGRR